MLSEAIEALVGAQTKLWQAQSYVRTCRVEVGRAISKEMSLGDALGMGLVSLNMSVLRRYVRNSKR